MGKTLRKQNGYKSSVGRAQCTQCFRLLNDRLIDIVLYRSCGGCFYSSFSGHCAVVIDRWTRVLSAGWMNVCQS